MKVDRRKANLIRFGTDGWRALVAEEFTFPNVRAVAQAVADFLREHPDPHATKAVEVGYDTRPLGDRFAEAVAEVLAGNGFEVWLTDAPTPTPAISFTIRARKLQGGIAVTASHNPFTYNGLKFKPAYAGPAEPAMTQWIERALFKRPIRRMPMEQALALKRIRRFDPFPAYLRFLRDYVDWSRLKRARLRVAYDSMHGAGHQPFELLFSDTHMEWFSIRNQIAIRRSTHRPEPVADELHELASWVRSKRCDVGLATDGDADRVGVVGPDGRFISSQETMALLLWHILEDRRGRGVVVSTVSGTNLLDAITQAYGVKLHRTPVGFKHIAHWMRTENVLFGGEESGGFGFQGCVPERDGLLGGLLILEMMVMRRKGLSALLHEMRRRFGRWFFAREDLSLTHPVSAERLHAWAQSASVRNQSFVGMGKVERIETLDGAKVVLEDRSWLLLRPSGTEPLLRIYAEASHPRGLKALIRWGQTVGRQLLR